MNTHIKAFTLVELLTVIVIIGILASISIGQFVKYQDRARLAKAQSSYTQVKKYMLAGGALSGRNDLFTFRYSFNGDDVQTSSSPYVIDKSGYHNHITSAPYSGTFYQDTDTPMRSGASVYMQRRAFFIMNNNQNTPINEFTVAVWIKLEAIPAPDRAEIPLSFHHGAGGAKGLGIKGNNGVVRLITGTDAISSPPKTIKLGKWHYVVGSFDGDTGRLWVDGELVAKQSGMRINGYIHSRFDVWSGYSNTAGKMDELIVLPYGFNGGKINN